MLAEPVAGIQDAFYFLGFGMGLRPVRASVESVGEAAPVALTAGCLFAMRDIPDGSRGNNADDDRATGAASPTDSTGARTGRTPMPKPKK